MAYTAYKFKPSFVEKRLKSYKSNLMKFKGHDNLVANAVRVIRERLEADPRRYLSYGPYWWGIKKVLVDNGVPLGECDDEEIRLAYSGATDEETIVMAEEFSQIRQEPGSVRISVSGEVIPGAAQRGCPLYLRCSMPDLMR